MAMEVQYKPCDWSEYNKALLERGRLILWFDSDDIQKWYDPNTNVKGRGMTRTYSDWTIEMLNTLRFMFNMPLRQTQGFAQSLFKLMGIDLVVPHYCTLSRRLETLACSLGNTLETDEPIHLALDSTGLKVYGEGEWKVRQHGYSKRRTWRKVHIAIDSHSQQIMNVVVSTNDFKDNELIEDLLEDIETPIEAVYADGAYDAKNVYDACDKAKARAVTPPRKGAKIKQHANSNDMPRQRDENIRVIRKKGRKNWKKDSDYHQRSLSETVMFRLKIVFGQYLKSRKFEVQAKEVFLKCKILNVFAKIGLANSVPVPV